MWTEDSKWIEADSASGRLERKGKTLRLRSVETPTSGKIGQKWGTQLHLPSQLKAGEDKGRAFSVSLPGVHGGISFYYIVLRYNNLEYQGTIESTA
jgi:hypothetical protein